MLQQSAPVRCSCALCTSPPESEALSAGYFISSCCVKPPAAPLHTETRASSRHPAQAPRANLRQPLGYAGHGEVFIFENREARPNYVRPQPLQYGGAGVGDSGCDGWKASSNGRFWDRALFFYNFFALLASLRGPRFRELETSARGWDS